jgi:hypothetical protein
MIEINESILKEVKPAFRKTIDSLLEEASNKIAEAGDLIEEASKLSALIGRKDYIKNDIDRIILKDNSTLIEDLFDVSRVKTSIPRDTPVKATRNCTDVKEYPEVPEEIETPKLYPRDQGDEPINLVMGEPLKKGPGRPKGSVGKDAKGCKVVKTPNNRKYRGVKTKVEYRGVTLVKNNSDSKRYRARVTIKGTDYEIGFFPSALEAAYAYDELKYSKTESLKGLNFPDRIEMRLRKKSLNS